MIIKLRVKVLFLYKSGSFMRVGISFVLIFVIVLILRWCLYIEVINKNCWMNENEFDDREIIFYF